MYIPAHFGVHSDSDALDAVNDYPFATLVSTTGGHMTVSQLPIWLDRATPALYGHLARANPHWQLLEAADEVVLVFTGPHGYVSPGWYVDPQMVPTWNYISVTVRGRAQLLTDLAEARQLVVRLSAQHEAQFAKPWTIDKVPEKKIETLLRAIVAFRIDIERIDAKAKLGQNRARADLEGVIAALEKSTQGSLQHQLAAAMQRALDTLAQPATAPDGRSS